MNINNDEITKEIDASLNKKYKKSIFVKFVKAISDYEMLAPGDKVAVCISGGKDSMIMAKLFQKLKRHNKFSFELEFIIMDPGYNNKNRQLIESNAKLLNIPVKFFETDIFDSVYNIEKSPCYLCARMRRGHLYKMAQELGCNKIALGHHFDDVIETILMSMLYGSEARTMMPKIHSTNFEGMELIRPMYYIREDDIIDWVEYNNLKFIQCACKFTEETSNNTKDKESGSKRLEIKNLIKELKQTNKQVENNIFRSMENVNLDTIISYRENGTIHNFLDRY